METTLATVRKCLQWAKSALCGVAAISFLGGPAFALDLPKYSPSTLPESTVQLAHGFHCRPMFGWDPRLGIYHKHRHEGICQDFQRCMKVMYRCNALMGKGWEPWSYERWGFDNWRFDKCMLDAGCY